MRALKQEGVSSGEKSNVIQKRVMSARAQQEKRFSHSDIHANADMNISHVRKYCKLPVEAEELLQRAATTFNLSARTYFRIIKVARTIADLMGSTDITPHHIAEAIQYRVKQ